MSKLIPKASKGIPLEYLQQIFKGGFELPKNAKQLKKFITSFIHDSNKPIKKFKLKDFNTYGVLAEGQPPFGVWISGRQGEPALTKAKYAKARELFASRPYRIEGNVSMNNPIYVEGDVPNRSALEWYAKLIGSDGVIYDGIYDNGYNNAMSIHSFIQPNIERIIKK